MLALVHEVSAICANNSMKITTASDTRITVENINKEGYQRLEDFTSEHGLKLHRSKYNESEAYISL